MSLETEKSNKMGGKVVVDDRTAWMVAFSSHAIHILTYGIAWSSAIFYILFLDAFEQSKKMTALVGSLMTASMYATGPLSNYLCRCVGTRITIGTGGLLAGSGLALSSMVVNINQLFFTYSIMAGAGFGLASIPSVFAVAQYFERKRTLALGFAASGVGIGMLIYPSMVTAIVEQYSWRGALLICGAITFNICIFALTVSPNRTKKCLASGRSHSDSDWTKIVRLFRSWPFVFMAINNLLYCFGLIIVYIHISAYVKTTFQVSSAVSGSYVSVLGVSNLIGRSAFGLLCHFTSLTSGCVYASSHLISAVAILLIPLADDVIFVAVCVAIFGFCSASIGTLMPSILSETLLATDFGYAYGFILIFEGIGTLAGGPFSGWLLDEFDNYPYLFYVSAAFNLSSAIILLRMPQGHRCCPLRSNDKTCKSVMEINKV